MNECSLIAVSGLAVCCTSCCLGHSSSICYAVLQRLYDDDLSEKRRAIEKLEGERLNLEKRIAVEIQKFEQVGSSCFILR